MTDKEIYRVLDEYITIEMNLLPEDADLPVFPPYSRKYRRCIRNLLGSYKYFNGRTRLYRIVRKVAVFAVIFLSLFTANTISAKVFGFDIWKQTISFISGIEMNEVTYKKNSSVDADVISKPLNDRPQFVPEEYELIHENTTWGLDLTWRRKGVTKPNYFNITYERIPLDENLKSMYDSAYETHKNVVISNLHGDLYIKGDECWVNWQDEKYVYHIYSSEIENAEENLLKMAESIYKIQ